MKAILVNIKWYKPFIVLIIFMQLVSCQSWILKKEPIENIINQKPEEVKIINRQQQKIKLSFPYLERDSIKSGRFDDNSNRMIAEGTISVPVQEISQIYVEKSDAHPTMVLLIFIGVITFLIVLWD